MVRSLRVSLELDSSTADPTPRAASSHADRPRPFARPFATVADFSVRLDSCAPIYTGVATQSHPPLVDPDAAMVLGIHSFSLPAASLVLLSLVSFSPPASSSLLPSFSLSPYSRYGLLRVRCFDRCADWPVGWFDGWPVS